MRLILFGLVLCLFEPVLAHIPGRFLIELALVRLWANHLPEDILSSRMMVIYASEGDNSGWKKDCELYHTSLIRMGLDPVFYLNVQDMYANTQIRTRYRQYIAGRRIKNTLVILDLGKKSVLIIPNKNNGDMDMSRPAWKSEGMLFSEPLLALGRSIKRENLAATNFLMPDRPEFVEDLRVFDGRKYTNYPGIIQRQEIALAMLPTVEIPAEISEAQQLKIEAYNREVNAKNEKLKAVFSKSAFDWMPLVYRNNGEVLREGIQYMVMIAGSRGSALKHFFDYPDDEPNPFLSVTQGALPNVPDLKRYKAEDFLYKVYLLQVRSDDVFLGQEWEADKTRQDALRNFMFTYKRQFE